MMIFSNLWKHRVRKFPTLGNFRIAIASLALASTAIAVVMCAWLVLMHARMVVSPAPQEMREGAFPWLTRLLLEGRNPKLASVITHINDTFKNYGKRQPTR